MKPIFVWSLFFISTHALSAAEMFDQNIQQKFITTMKDNEVTSILQKTKEFDECRQINKFDQKNPPNNPEDSLNKAVKCFQDKLKSKDAKALAEISDNLGLESFGLVRSKNIAEIQSYLSDTMYKALTGIDLREKNKEKLMESMKFKNRKQIDQKTFIDLYTAQLTKNALFEVSRFCFENLRLETPTASEDSDFATYWGGSVGSLNPSLLTDTGSKGLGKFSGDEKKIYEEIFQNVGLNAKTNLTDMGNFFAVCMTTISPLCKIYEQSKGAAPKGANACLVQGKLIKIKKALADAERIKKEEFEKMAETGSFQILFDDGSKAQPTTDKSIDDLTAQSSASILSSNISNATDEAAKRCKTTNSNSQECQNFIQVGNDYNSNIHNQEMEMTFKSEAEKARVSKLVEAKDPKTVSDYLNQKGYFDIIDDLKTNPNLDVVARVGEKLDAEKNAALSAIKNKLGSRQLTESEAKGGKKEEIIQKNAQDISEERARLAQVVLFNNIITSQLDIKNNTTKKSAGRNISGIKKEISELKNNPNVNTAYFEGLQKTVDDPSNSSADNNGALSGSGLIDTILGKPSN